jgi:hypothetical protein
MYVCMCVRMYVCYVCVYVHIMYVFMSVCVYVCMYMCVCMYIYMSVCVFVCIYIYMCVSVCMYVCMYVCAHARSNYTYTIHQKEEAHVCSSIPVFGGADEGSDSVVTTCMRGCNCRV